MNFDDGLRRCLTNFQPRRGDMSSGRNVDVGRIFDPPDQDGGYRVLVDRIWPRGLSKATAALDEWCRDIAPSTALRRWYGHDRARFPIFRDRYLAELDDPARGEPLAHLVALATARRLILLTATRDVDISHVRVLAERLSSGRSTGAPP